MAKIDIQRSHSLSMEKIREAAQELVETLEKDFGLEHTWENENLVKFSCAPKGIKGTLSVEPKKLHLNVKLGLLASMFERPLRKEIEEYLNTHLS